MILLPEVTYSVFMKNISILSIIGYGHNLVLGFSLDIWTYKLFVLTKRILFNLKKTNLIYIFDSTFCGRVWINQIFISLPIVGSFITIAATVSEFFTSRPIIPHFTLCLVLGTMHYMYLTLHSLSLKLCSAKTDLKNIVQCSNLVIQHSSENCP